jgi:hypothetical protein
MKDHTMEKGSADVTPNPTQGLTEAADLLTNLTQILDVVKREWTAGGQWSDWDQQQRDKITDWLMRYSAPPSAEGK